MIAVFGFDAARVSQSAPAGVVPVENPDYRLGMLTSLKAGLRAVPDSCDAVLFTLVDHPAVLPSTVDAVMRVRRLSLPFRVLKTGGGIPC